MRVSSVLACFVSKWNEQASIYDCVVTCDPNKKGPATGTDKKRLAVMLTIKGVTHVVEDEKLVLRTRLTQVLLHFHHEMTKNILNHTEL